MDTVLELLRELAPSVEIDETTDLMKTGVLRSLTMMMLVANLNEEFDIEISVRDIVPENFMTPRDICALVRRLSEEEEG